MSVSFEELRGDLPDHHAELMANHEGRPSIGEQDRTHGAGLPAEDHGIADDQKYC